MSEITSIRRETEDLVAMMRSTQDERRAARLRERICAINDPVVVRIAGRLGRRFGIEFEDAAQEVRALLVERLDCWNPKRSHLDRWMWFEASERLRAIAESSSRTGLSGTAAAKRRLRRASSVAAALADELGREPLDGEIVDETNRQAFARQRDPHRSGSLLSVDELRRSRAAFGGAADFDDLYQPNFILHPDEGRAFVDEALDHVASILGAPHRDALVARFSLEQPDTVGDLRPWAEVAAITSIPSASVKHLAMEAARLIGDWAVNGRSYHPGLEELAGARPHRG